MKKRKFSILLLALILIISTFNTSIKEVYAEDDLGLIANSDEITVSIPDESSDTITTRKGIRLPNAVTVRVSPSETGLTIKVNNIGVDTIDSVTVTIKSPKMYSQKGSNSKTVTFVNVPPALTKTKTMSIPMIRTKMTYTGSVVIRDGGKVAYKDTKSSLSFSNETLSQEWLKGTFPNLRDSLDYHFEKHHADKYVKVKNIAQYLRVSSSARQEMKNINKSNSKYTVTYPKTNSKKVLNKITKRYILLNKNNKKLYSFGGR